MKVEIVTLVQSTNKAILLLVAFLSLAGIVTAQECADVEPLGKFTCEQQKDFGKCQSSWMLVGGFCAESCGRCSATFNPPSSMSGLAAGTQDPSFEASIPTLAAPSLEPIPPSPPAPAPVTETQISETPSPSSSPEPAMETTAALPSESSVRFGTTVPLEALAEYTSSPPSLTPASSPQANPSEPVSPPFPPNDLPTSTEPASADAPVPEAERIREELIASANLLAPSTADVNEPLTLGVADVDEQPADFSALHLPAPAAPFRAPVSSPATIGDPQLNGQPNKIVAEDQPVKPLQQELIPVGNALAASATNAPGQLRGAAPAPEGEASMDMLEEAAEQLIEGEALPFLLPVIQPPEPQDRPGASAAAGLQAEVAPDLTLVPSLGAPAAAQAEVARGNRSEVCPPGQRPTPLQAIFSKPDLLSFASAINSSGFNEVLTDNIGNITVFAPVNAAFEQTTEQLGVSIDALVTSRNLMQDIAGTSIVEGQSLNAEQLFIGTSISPIDASNPLFVVNEGGVLQILSAGSTASVIAPNLLQGCGWIIHGIDAVLSPIPANGGINPVWAALALADEAGITSGGK